MKIRWSKAAIADLEDISAYIRKRNPQAALSVKARIIAAIISLEQFPEIGRPTQRPGYRLLVVKNLPYLIGYRISAEHVDIAAILDGRMNRSGDIL